METHFALENRENRN